MGLSPPPLLSCPSRKIEVDKPVVVFDWIEILDLKSDRSQLVQWDFLLEFCVHNPLLRKLVYEVFFDCVQMYEGKRL